MQILTINSAITLCVKEKFVYRTLQSTHKTHIRVEKPLKCGQGRAMHSVMTISLGRIENDNFLNFETHYHKKDEKKFINQRILY